jgi:hypothetical protein
MSNTISASISGGTINASVSGSSASASVGSSGSPVQASVSGGGISASGGPAIAPVQSVNGQIGHVIVPVVPFPPVKPPEMALFTTVMSSGTFSLSARSSPGRVAVLWWDGSVQIFGNGVANQYQLASKSVPASGNWSGSSPKSVIAWPCTSATSAVAFGSFTGLACTSKSLTYLSVDGCDSLTELSCDSNRLTSLHVSGCPSLVSLSCHLNQIRELDVSGCQWMASLSCQANALRGLNVTKNTALQSLSCGSNQLTSLNVSQNPLLAGLYCNSNFIETLDLSLNTALTNVNASNNLLTSVRATGIRVTGAAGMNVSNNQLSAASLNALYSDLAAVASGSIYVSGNPGVSSDSPAIATAKGYAVYG